MKSDHPTVAGRRRARTRRLFGLLAATAFCVAAAMPALAVTLAPSQRIEVNLGEQPWKYIKDQDPANAQSPSFNDASWKTVGLPYSADQLDTFINEVSGGGQGELSGTINWYRTTLTHSADYAGKKVMVEFEGAHMGAQVYVNGQLIPGTSTVAADKNATHVVGFIPFIVDLTPYLRFDGTDVLAVKVARDDAFFEDPGFSGAFRFGQADAGIFRPVRLHVTDKVYIPANVYSGQNTWGTYVGTVSASDDSATIRVETNVANERDSAQTVTLTTQIVDAQGNVVATAQDQKTLAAHTIPGDATPVFDQTLTVAKPTLWYPNNSIYGKPYMYKVFHTVSIDGQVVDAVQSPLGIRTITWDKDFPYINGHKHYLWGASGRYDYPALGTSVPEEQQWRDLELLAKAGGNLWRPGHSTSSPEFVAAADTYGIFIVQPSGDGENGFATACSPAAANFQSCSDGVALKKELHRDMIIRDRSHPAILAWEANNGVMNTPLAQELKAISQTWDPINTRAQADRTPNADNGDILSCSKAGCEVYLHQNQYPNKPAWGAEYWGLGTERQAYDFELAYALSYLDPWTQGRKVNTFGMAQWYFADSPGENIGYVEGTSNMLVRSIGSSMVDMNRFPRMLYYIYQANWVPYSLQPVVRLAHHWNRSGDVRVNAFSNCPSVRLLINGQQAGPDQVPNPWDSDSSADDALVNSVDPTTGNPIVANTSKGQQTTKLPGQVHWDVTWQAGKVTAQCLDNLGNVVASDEKVTAGKADHIQLEMVPELVKPDGTSFQLTANGSDAAFVVAKVVDADGNVVPEGADVNVTFSTPAEATGLVTYQGGSQQLVTPGKPITYHAPGDHELQFEGGMTKIALRTGFQTGQVDVTATAPGLGDGHVSFNIVDVPNPVTALGAPSIIAQPIKTDVTAGQPAHFSVTASGAQPLSFQWRKNGVPVAGVDGATLDTPNTTLDDDGAVYTVVVSNNQGSETSSTAVLHVVAAAPVTIQQAPQPQNVDAGQTAQFSVQATGSPTVTYQWLKNGTAIANATNPTYSTGVLTTDDNAETYSVQVTNPVNQVTTTPVRLTVNPARAPTVITQPSSVVINPGQPAQFSVTVDGSAPFHYQWSKDGTNVGEDAATLNIAAVQPADAGSYAVTVSNQAGVATSAAATLKLAPPGANLALSKKTFDSSEENANGTQGPNAVDGDATTRWGSQFTDNEWLDVDLGSVRTFNRAVLNWENAHASSYKIQYSNDRQSWQDAYSEDNSPGGVEDVSFASVNARYVRMQGVKRATDYGYSLFEFEVYDGANCGGPNERYTVDDTTSVTDNLSKLVWSRVPHTLTDPGAQFTQPKAMQYCQSVNMRLPTRAEAKAISGANASTCAFPIQWNTWTSETDPTDSTFGYTVSSNGDINRVVSDNFPGQALCVAGDVVQPPVVTADPTNQTAGVGRIAHFSVTATGAGPLSYEWFRNGKSVYVSNDPSYDTPVAKATDDGASYTVQVTSAQGLTVASAAAVLTVDNSDNGTLPPAGDPGNGGNNNDNGGGGNGDTGDNSPGDGKGGINLALGKPAFESGSENDGYLSASQAFDGDFTNTRWSSAFEDPSWIAVDLGAPHTFDHVVLRWERAYSTNYDLQISDDNQNWQTFHSNPNGAGGTERISFAPQTARYVRMKSYARSSQYGVSLWEFEIYAAAAPVIAPLPATQTVAPGQTAQFSADVQGSGPLSYQWRRNGTAVADATQASYGFVAQQADSGSAFDVVVTDDNGASATSSATVLTVQAASGTDGNGNTGSTGNGSGQQSTIDLALNRPATASTEQDPVAFKAANVDDGDLGTRWSSAFSDPQWVAVDLGSVQPVNRVVLSWEDAHATAYQIQTSTDGQNWTVAYDQPNGAGGVETAAFPTVQARYLRMYGTQRSNQYGYSLWELAVFNDGGSAGVPGNGSGTGGNTGTGSTGTGTGNSGTGTSPTAPTSANLALHQPVTVSGVQDPTAFKGGNATDGDTGTRWSSAFADPQWIAVDLGSAKTVSRVVLNWENAHATAYQIQTSTDGQNWTVAYDQPNGAGGVETLNFPAVSARYVRMYGTKRSTDYGYSLWEFEVYGDGSGTSGSGQSGTGSGDNGGTGTGGNNGTGSGNTGTDPNQPPDYTVYPGVIGTELQNNTHGAFADDQIYIAVLGRDPVTNVFSWLKPDGTITPAAVADNDAPGHLTKNGQNYPNYAFTLAQAKLMKLPKMSSGRIFVSLGEPLYIKILDDANGDVGFAGPNPLNATDPNIDVRFDWYEFTYGDTGLWINTTQVDEFGIPLLLDVWGDSKQFHMQTGIQQSHDAIYAAYATEVPAEFQQALQNPLRIMAPGKSSFDVGQPNEHYFDAYVDQIWSYYTTNTLTVDMWSGSRRFAGKVQNGTLVFTEVDLGNGAYVGGTYNVQKPTTQDILEGKGTLAQGNSTELALEAQICAAFNRHIMENASLWAVPSAWYLASPANYYARFWHNHSVSGLAYGFAYDDVSDQSSTIISPTPEHMILGIGW